MFKKFLFVSAVIISLPLNGYAQSLKNDPNVIIKEGDGETQTPPVQLHCPCMVTWQMNPDNNNPINFFNFDLKPLNSDFPISVATMARTLKGEYFIPPNQSGSYMMHITGTGHWLVQIKQNYQQ